jgi:uncharacterized membrane protein YgaE (UPF0421/DUF939 family)
VTTETWRDRLGRHLNAQASGRIGISYLARVTISAVASLLVSRALAIANPIWAVVSAVVVILPDANASVASAGLRVVANLIGAGVGAAIAAATLPPIAALVVGLCVVAGACRWLGVDAAARSAGVALIIVLLRDDTNALTRVGLVMLGCTVALVVTIAVAQVERVVGGWRQRCRDAAAKAREARSAG